MFSPALWRFLAVGVLSACCDYGSRMALLWLGMAPVPSRAASFIFGSTVAYLLNSAVTFQGKRNAGEAGRAGVAYAMSFGTAVTADAVCRGYLYGGPYAVTVAWVFSQGCATALNYLLQSRWVFREG
ncbi:GtrA family protein [Corynebacterium lowii]|uniref:GtrA-like protein n=1 Tax=Corynebacterium lowii TaxID=1544413 RepID=A0A0Q0U7Q0_9CORY|nr:GtrA family protein [Corynebacterium lowii]KQB83447.1 GtrA-like protein [Corynebacterium lowii]MDP9852492.1 putative flippase GtrA [Corynebacterium lowii]